MILLFLIMRCTPTIRELIEATPLSLASLDRLPASRLLLPRSGLERSDFVLWHKADLVLAERNVRYWEKSGRQPLSCAPGVEREIFSSSSFMSADTSAKRGVLK